MIQLIKSETLKLVTTRTPLWLLAGMIFIAGPGVLLAGKSTSETLSKPLEEQVWFFIAAGFTRLLVLILGVRMVTDEFRHGTMVPTVLSSPARWRIVASKAAVVGVAGVVLTAIAEVVMLGTSAAVIATEGATFTVTSQTITALGGMAVAGGLWAMVGAGLGTLLRRQTIAVVGALLWLLPGGGLEEIIRSQLGSGADWLPGNQGMALALVPGDGVPFVSAAALAGYAALIVVGGIVLMRRRDV